MSQGRHRLLCNAVSKLVSAGYVPFTRWETNPANTLYPPLLAGKQIDIRPVIYLHSIYTGYILIYSQRLFTLPIWDM